MPDQRYDVFLSFHQEDRAAVEQIARYLSQTAKLCPWYDDWELIPGEPWVRNLERGLQASATCAVFAGQRGEGPWQQMEVETALRAQVHQPDFRVIPVLLPDAPRQPELPLFLSGNLWVDFRGKTLTDDDALWRLECGIRGIAPGAGRPASAALRPDIRPPPYRPLLYKMCNRQDQNFEFQQFFDRRGQECPQAPHFYFLPGAEDDCHHSFIERLELTHIKTFANRTRGATQAAVDSKTVLWPERGALADQQDQLSRAFFDAYLNQAFDVSEFEPRLLTLLQTLSQRLDKYAAVIIRHDLHASRWDRRQCRLLLWYIKECWGVLPYHDAMPQFVIFFNIIYPPPPRALWEKLRPHAISKTALVKELCALHNSTGAPDPCQLLQELNPITREHVYEWFSLNRIYEQWQWKKHLDAIFSEHGRPVLARPMADIEEYLQELVKNYHQERRL